MISQKNSLFQARSCKRQLDLQLFSLQHFPSQYSPGESLAPKELVRPAQEMEPIPLLKLIVLQGLQIAFYRETEKLQFFWLNTELWCLWARGQIIWTLCNSPSSHSYPWKRKSTKMHWRSYNNTHFILLFSFLLLLCYILLFITYMFYFYAHSNTYYASRAWSFW